MSFRVVGKILRHSNEKLARRLILIVLGEAAHDDGVVWLDQSTIALKARLSRTHVAEMLREMEEAAVLEVRKAQRGRKRISVYRITLPGLDEPDYERLPFALDRPFTVSEVPTRSEPDDVGISEVTTSESPSRVLVVQSEPSIGTGTTGAAALAAVPKAVDRRPVTGAEATLAVAVLEEWNRQTGQRLASRDWLAKIILRVREYPDLDAAAHAAIIAASLAAPWWRGPATPSVVYGSGAQFERSILTASARTPNGNGNDRRVTGPAGGPTPEEMIRRAREMAEAGR